MCGRYTVTRYEGIVEDLEAALDPAVAKDPWWKPRWNVAPTQPAPVVTRAGGARTIALMRWGLIPPWAGPGGKPLPLMINARLESVHAKQVFRDALAHQRCLVPADGFFEWVRAEPAGRKAGKPAPRPFYFHPRAHRLCAFAGLWARSRTERGDELHSFTIITAPASDLVRPVHDRMPIVLDPSAHDAWLDPALDGDGARALLGVPAAPADWIREPVSTWVNKADHDDPGCIAPDAPDAPGPPPAQGRLFD